MSLVRRAPYTVPAVVNWSRWLARCPVCPSADELREPFAPLFGCIACGAIAEVVWPSEEMVYGITRLLLMRPSEQNRNWEPGETLQDLAWENAAHGVFTDLPEGLDRLVIEPERIRMDTLPATFRRELKAIG